MERRGSRSLRGRAEAIIAVLFALGIIAAGAGGMWFVSTINPPHTDPAAVPSSLAAPPDARVARAAGDAAKLVRGLIVEEHLPGVSIAVAVDGRVVWAEGFGWGNVETHAPVTPETRYRIGSISKTLTAVAAGLLRDRGRLDLDAPVQQYVSDYPAKQWALTTRQLMADVGGVHRIVKGGELLPARGCRSVNDSLRTFAGEPLFFQPGTQYRFSAYAWILASAVVERVAGRPFGDFMASDVFAPLGLTRTVVDGEKVEGRASFYFPRAAERADLGLQEAPYADYSCFAGAGQYVSTPTDLVRGASAMLKPGFLTADTIAVFQAPVMLASGAPSGYALGWKVDDVQVNGETTRQLSHRGSPMGGSASVWIYPGRGLAIAAMTNVSHVKGIAPLGPKVAEAFVR